VRTYLPRTPIGRYGRKVEEGEDTTHVYATDWGFWTRDEHRQAFTQPKEYEIVMRIRDKLKEYGTLQHRYWTSIH
jgi:hypothetical protein